MTVLTDTEAQRWCETHGHALGKRAGPVVRSDAERFTIPADAGQRVAMVARHLADWKNESEVLVWFTEWGVWPSGERPHIFDRFRASYGETRSLIDSPGHLFSGAEFEDMLSFVTLGVLFLWDVFVVGKGLLHYPHDAFGRQVL